jgi:hypothetical protein
MSNADYPEIGRGEEGESSHHSTTTFVAACGEGPQGNKGIGKGREVTKWGWQLLLPSLP